MLLKFLKYQFKSRAYLAQIIFVIFTIYHFISMPTDMSRIGIFFLQGIFYDVIRRSNINLQLVWTSRFPLRKLLWLHNVGYFIWFNLWFLLAETILVVFAHEPMAESFRSIFRFEILLVMATVVGNVISNSDYVTIKSKFWQYSAAATVFTLCYLITSMGVRIVWHLWHSYLLLIIATAGLVLLWNYQLKTVTHFHFFKYLIKKEHD